MRALFLFLVVGALGLPFGVAGAEARILKVLQHHLDLQGKHTTSPSLFERDAYQAELRKNPALVSGVRFDVHWKASGFGAGGLRLRVETRTASTANQGKGATLESSVTPRRRASRWSAVELTGEAFKAHGPITAWRATLWDGDHLVAEQKSFLW